MSNNENRKIVSFVPKVLIVDDMPENQRAFKRILNTVGVQIFSALSGMEALALTLRHRFSVILMDVMMPEMDGLETASLLRINEETKSVPIIFITAGDKGESLEFKGYELGGCDYLYKPVLPAVLTGKVQVFIELERQKQTLQSRIDDLFFMQSRYELLLSMMSEAVFELDSDGIIRSVSPAAIDLLGYEKHQLVGVEISSIIAFDQSNSWSETRLYRECCQQQLSLSDLQCRFESDGEAVTLTYSADHLALDDETPLVIVVISAKD